MRRYTPEFQSRNIHLENLSRKERLRVLGVQAVCAGLVDTPAEVVLAEPPPIELSEQQVLIFDHDKET